MEIFILMGISTVTQLLKKHIYPRYGEDGIHLATLVIAMVFHGLFLIVRGNPTLINLVAGAGAYLASSIGIYEVLLKHLVFSETKDLIK